MHAVITVGFVGKRSDFLAEVMPLLYRGIVHSGAA